MVPPWYDGSMVKDKPKCGICGLPTRMQYPGNDPENGPARPMCTSAHSQCEWCDVWLEHAGVCDECGRCPNCEDPSDEKLAELRVTGCNACSSPPFCYDDHGPDTCALCGHDVPSGEGVMKLVDLDPGNAEVGPQPDVGEYLCHTSCPAGPKAWDEYR